jgi:hypothetical protein
MQCKKPCPLYPRKRTLPATSSASSASKRLPARQSRGWRRRSSVAELDGLLRPDPLQDRRAWSGRPCCSLSCCFSFHEVLVVAVLDPALYLLGCCGSLHPPVEVDHANFVVTVCFLMASQPRRGVLRLDRCSERVELRRVMNPDLKANFIAEL